MTETKRSMLSAELGNNFVLVFKESRMALFITAFPATIFAWVFVRLL